MSNVKFAPGDKIFVFSDIPYIYEEEGGPGWHEDMSMFIGTWVTLKQEDMNWWTIEEDAGTFCWWPKAHTEHPRSVSNKAEVAEVVYEGPWDLL